MKSFLTKSGIYSIKYGLVVLASLIAYFMVLSSCKKNEEQEKPIIEMDAESVYNIELQELQAANFNSLLQSLDTLQAADSILQLFLADSHVVSGEVNEQAVFVDYSDGTSGGIFFDPQDSPGMEFPFPDKMNAGPGKTNSYIIPSVKRTILINPHYFERKEYTNPLLEVYDNLFAGIGYEIFERYFNDECNIELFTHLEDYGFIHIYSHGIKRDDKVYLMTGESPNATSHNTYKQNRLDKEVIIITHAVDSLTRYFLDPSFIVNQNDFTIHKPLIYGGFCYSFLGDWPDQLKYDGASGYFGFDWSVLTTANVYWAKNLVSYLTDYSVNEPYSASWWIESSPVEKEYWDSHYKQWVSIDYEGVEDLVLWSWAGSGYSSANISLQVDGTFEDSDGEITNEVYEIPVSALMEHSVEFTGSSYSSSWHNELFFDRTRSGNIEVVIRPDRKELTYFSFNDTVVPGASVYHYKYKIELTGLPLVSEDNEKAIFEITGVNACSAIDQLEYRTDYVSGYTLGWKMMTSYNCSSPGSKVSVIMYK